MGDSHLEPRVGPGLLGRGDLRVGEGSWAEQPGRRVWAVARPGFVSLVLPGREGVLTRVQHTFPVCVCVP